MIKEKLPLMVESMAFSLGVFMIGVDKDSVNGLQKVWTASFVLDNVDYVDIYIFLDMI